MDGVKIASDNAIIEGVKVIPLQRFPDERGLVYHMLKATDPHFLQFGEIYFSTVYPGVVKAWKSHRRATVNYACIFGCIRLVLYDERDSSPTKGVFMQILLGPDHYSLVVVPPSVWNGFQGMSEPLAILANCSTEPYDSSEFERVDPLKNHIHFTW